MPTVDEVLNIERSFLGEGGQRFWAWYPAAPGTAWCCIFQSYCLTAAGIDTHYAWVSGLFDQYRSEGRNSYDIRTAQPGDLIAFEWNSTPGGYDHIAMVESVDSAGVTAINGNVNGSRVQRLWHPFNGGGIAEIARPPYDTPTPSPEEDDVKDALIRDPRDGAIYRITQPGNLAVHLDADAWASAVQAGIPMIGNVDPGVLGNFGLVPSINASKK
jgi:hypothetical protein